MFKNPFLFEGRIRRLEYGISRIINYITLGFLSFLMETIIRGGGDPTFILLFCIPIIWFGLAQAVKRSHDVGNSGWWVLVPFYGLYLLFKDGEIGENQYGENPKGIVSFTPPNNPQYTNNGWYQNGNNFGGYNGGYNNQQQRQPQQGGSFYNGGHNANNQQQWQQQPPQTTPQQPKGNGKEFDGNLYGKAN